MPPPPLILAAPNGRSTSVSMDCLLGRAFVERELGVLDPTMSRAHCQIQWRGRHYWIRDGSRDGLGSLLGTVMDGKRLLPGHWEPIPPCTSLRIGETTLTLRYESPYSTDYDLMISYSRKDETSVLEIYRSMMDLGLTPWIDQTGNRPAAHYLLDIEKILDECSAAAVFWGGDHMGNTQAAEVDVIKARHIQKRIRSLFLVVLPGSTDPDFGALLTTIDYYDLRKAGELNRLMRNLDKALLTGEGDA